MAKAKKQMYLVSQLAIRELEDGTILPCTLTLKVKARSAKKAIKKFEREVEENSVEVMFNCEDCIELYYPSVVLIDKIAIIE
mgnify:CR=1 FL=1